MENVLSDIKDAHIYINDAGAFSNDWDHHVNLLATILWRLRRINQQKVLVFDNDNVKYDIILGTNFLSETGIKLNYSEGNMEWFDCSIPLCPPGGLDLKELTPWKTCFTSKSKTSSLVKIGLNALQQRF
jgi:hypothetical protein